MLKADMSNNVNEYLKGNCLEPFLKYFKLENVFSEIARCKFTDFLSSCNSYRGLSNLSHELYTGSLCITSLAFLKCFPSATWKMYHLVVTLQLTF